VTVSHEVTKLEHSSVRLTVTVGQEDVRSEYDEMVDGYIKTIQIRGFRKGKVPRDVLIRKFGDVLKDDVLEKIIEESLKEVLSGENFLEADRPLAYSKPQVEGTPKLDLEKDVTYSVIYDVFPHVQVGSWQGKEIEIPDVSIEEEDVDRELEELREQNAVVYDKGEGESAALGDVVTIDFWLRDPEGRVLEETEREDFACTLGSGNTPYKFDEDMVGMKVGETRDFEKTYPVEEEDKDLAGTTRKFRVKLKSLKVRNLPDLDDEFAQDVDEKFLTLEDLRKSIRERMEKALEIRRTNLQVDRILDNLIENSQVDVPQSMINLEMGVFSEGLAEAFGVDERAVKDTLASLSEDERKTRQQDTERRLKKRIIVATLLKDLGIEAGDEEVQAEIEKRVQEYGHDKEEARAYYENPSQRENLKDELQNQKLYRRLISETVIKIGEKQKYKDLIREGW